MSIWKQKCLLHNAAKPSFRPKLTFFTQFLICMAESAKLPKSAKFIRNEGLVIKNSDLNKNSYCIHNVPMPKTVDTKVSIAAFRSLLFKTTILPLQNVVKLLPLILQQMCFVEQNPLGVADKLSFNQIHDDHLP